MYTVIILIFVILCLFIGHVSYQFMDSYLLIHSPYWKDFILTYSDVQSIQIVSNQQIGLRTFGFGNLKLSMGSFHNNLYGDYKRYTYKSCPICIEIHLGQTILVINENNEQATNELFNELNKRVSL